MILSIKVVLVVVAAASVADHVSSAFVGRGLPRFNLIDMGLSPSPTAGGGASRGTSSVLFVTAATGESEVERLLRKARELRAEAEQAKHQVHVDQAEKKAKKDSKTDDLVKSLFFAPNGAKKNSKNVLVDTLREKQLCMDTLEAIVNRLDEREVIAEGREHVEFQMGSDGQAEFRRVSQRDESELSMIEGCIDNLIDALKVLDDEFFQQKQSKGEVYVSHTEDVHWGGGKRAERLLNHVHEIRRVREEQWQERMEEFYEAQRIHKKNPSKKKSDGDDSGSSNNNNNNDRLAIP